MSPDYTAKSVYVRKSLQGFNLPNAYCFSVERNFRLNHVTDQLWKNMQFVMELFKVLCRFFDTLKIFFFSLSQYCRQMHACWCVCLQIANGHKLKRNLSCRRVNILELSNIVTLLLTFISYIPDYFQYSSRRQNFFFFLIREFPSFTLSPLPLLLAKDNAPFILTLIFTFPLLLLSFSSYWSETCSHISTCWQVFQMVPCVCFLLGSPCWTV
jgi:hypothetical protein